VSNPFVAPPAEDMVGYTVPDASEDPFRPIGQTDPETGAYLNPKQPAKVECNGKCIALKTEEKAAGPCVVLTFVATEGAFAGREFELYVSYSPKARFKVVETYTAMNLPLDRPYPKAQAIGTHVVLCLQDEEYEGRWSAKLKKVKAHPKGAGFRGAAELPNF